MKNAFKLAATINAAFALIGLLLMKITIYPIIMLLLSVIYITLSESEKELYCKKSKIILLSIITLFINPISGIILLIGQDKIPVQEEKEHLSKQDKKTITLLNLGIGLVGLSGIILTTTNWNIMSDTIKISILLLIAVIFLVLSIVSEKKLKIELLAKNYWLLSMLFIILTVIANGYLGIISQWFSFKGEGHYLYIALTTIITSLLSLITYSKYNKQIYKNISYIGIIASVAAILLHFELEHSIVLTIITAVLILLNVIKGNNEIRELSEYFSYIIAIISIILLPQASNVIITIVLSIITIINLMIVVLRATQMESVISSILINITLITTIFAIQNPLELSDQMISMIIAVIYSLVYLSNLIKTDRINNAFKITMNIITNIVLAILLLSNVEDKLILTFIAGLTAFTSLLNYNQNTIKPEKILLPIKITIFIISAIALLRETINIEASYILIGIYIVIYAIYKLIKNKSIQTISLILYYILFTITLRETISIIPALLNIAFSLIVLFLATKEDSTKKLKISYIATLIAITTAFAHTNILSTTQLNNGIIILLIYLIFTVINCKNEKLNKISYLSLILPLCIITSDYIENFEIKQIINNSIAMYAILLVNIFLVKDSKDRNILSTILIGIVIFQIMFFESWMIALYVGIISLILIIIGYIKKEYKGLFIEGIAITIANLLIQLKYTLQELPLWIYTLLAGLIIIGIVTYKAIKDNNK